MRRPNAGDPSAFGIEKAIEAEARGFRRPKCATLPRLSAPWFFVENYFYDRVLELTDAETGGTDPFTRQKASG